MLKWIGAAMTVLGCSAAGFAAADAYRREERYLLELLRVMQTMRWELGCRRSCLSQLFTQAAECCTGALRRSFSDMAGRLERCEAVDVRSCMGEVLGRQELPGSVRKLLEQMGFCIGSFDIDAQTEQLQIIEEQCAKKLEEFGKERDGKLRLYRVLGICSGLALAIVFI